MKLTKNELERWMAQHKLKPPLHDPMPVCWNGAWPVGEVMLSGRLMGLLFSSKRLLAWGEFIPSNGGKPLTVGPEAAVVTLQSAEPYKPQKEA